MKLSRILKLMLAAAFPLYAIADESATAGPSSTEAAASTPAVDAAATVATDSQPATDTTSAADAATDVTPVIEAPAVAPVVDAAPEAGEKDDESQDPAADPAVDSSVGGAVNSAPVVQTPTPVDEPGNATDPVLETVKTPAHNVADEIQEQIKKLEELPAEVAAWFESKFVELAAHIKALL